MWLFQKIFLSFNGLDGFFLFCYILIDIVRSKMTSHRYYKACSNETTKTFDFFYRGWADLVTKEAKVKKIAWISCKLVQLDANNRTKILIQDGSMAEIGKVKRSERYPRNLSKKLLLFVYLLRINKWIHLVRMSFEQLEEKNLNTYSALIWA